MEVYWNIYKKGMVEIGRRPHSNANSMNSGESKATSKLEDRIPTVKLKILGKTFLKSEVLDSDFKNAFPRIFNFTVGILSIIRGY